MSGREILRDEIRMAVKEALVESGVIKAIDSSQQPHATHVSSCPECYKSTLETMNKTSDFFCANCGLGLGDEAFAKKLDSCPNCNAKEARKRRE